MDFKNWMNNQPPAIVKQDNNQLKVLLGKFIKDVDLSKNYLLNAVSMFQLNENSHHAKRNGEFLLKNEKFMNLLRSRVGNISPIRDGVYGYRTSSGKDSCAFFFTNNYVVKFLGGVADNKEYNIAKAIKGELKVVPIVDAFQVEMTESGEVQYVVVMKKLVTDTYSISSEIKEAAEHISAIAWELQIKVSQNPSITPEYVAKKLSLGSILKEYRFADEGFKNAVKDLLKIIRLVYDRTGYLFGADLGDGGRNLGLTPKKGKVMTFDFGRPDLHRAKSETLPDQPDDEPEKI